MLIGPQLQNPAMNTPPYHRSVSGQNSCFGQRTVQHRTTVSFELSKRDSKSINMKVAMAAACVVGAQAFVAPRWVW